MKKLLEVKIGHFEDDSKFYLDNKCINSEEALKIIKENCNFNIGNDYLGVVVYMSKAEYEKLNSNLD